MDKVKIGDYIVYKDLSASLYRDTIENIVNNIGRQIKSIVEKYNKNIKDKIPLYYVEISKKINSLISYYDSIDKEKLSFDIKTYFYIKVFDFKSLFLQSKFLFNESNPVQIQTMLHTPNSLSNIFDE